MKERLLYGLDLDQIRSLDLFRGILKDYIRSYNTRYHSGIRGVPFERYLNTRDRMRLPVSREWLDECFLNRVFRKVRRDSTVSIDSQSYDVPMQFISQKVEIRFPPDDMSGAFILYDRERFPIVATDRNANCHTKRNPPVPIDYARR